MIRLDFSDPNHVEEITETVRKLAEQRDQARREVTDMAAKVLRLDGELINIRAELALRKSQLEAARYELSAEIAAFKKMRAERDAQTALTQRLDTELIDAHGRIETLEEQLAGALAELHAWKIIATADD